MPHSHLLCVGNCLQVCHTGFVATYQGMLLCICSLWSNCGFWLACYLCVLPQVIYGDTDSIMINTGSNDLAAARELGQRIKREVNKR